LTGRPVVGLSFAANYAVTGSGVQGYRSVNLAIHVLCALVLMGVVRQTLRGPRVSAWFRERADGLAFAVALLWAVHPLGTEVVGYLTQRTESMMALWFLIALYASIRALDARRRARWSLIAVAACLAGTGSKETIATAPLAVMLYDRIFAFDSFREAWRSRQVLYLGLMASWIVLGVGVALASREFSGGYSSTAVSVWGYLLNQAVVVTHYVRLAFWPDALVAFYGWAKPATIAAVWPQAVFITVLLAGTVVLLIRKPMLGFLAAWFFLTLAPSSSVLPIAAEVGADRRMYLPLIGVIALAVVVVAKLRLSGPVLVALLIAGATALSARTVTRNHEYRSELAL
jgi:hypothetical protein